jgi:hypothetical protein
MNFNALQVCIYVCGGEKLNLTGTEREPFLLLLQSPHVKFHQKLLHGCIERVIRIVVMFEPEFRLVQVVNHRSIFDVNNIWEPKQFWMQINTREQR